MKRLGLAIFCLRPTITITDTIITNYNHTCNITTLFIYNSHNGLFCTMKLCWLYIAYKIIENNKMSEVFYNSPGVVVVVQSGQHLLDGVVVQSQVTCSHITAPCYRTRKKSYTR